MRDGPVCDDPRGGVLWTGEVQHARATLVGATHAALRAAAPDLDARLAPSTVAHLCLWLLRELGSPFADGMTPDEAASDILWRAHGLPTFQLTASACAALFLTDPGKLAQRDVPWPFPSFRVVLPHPDCPVMFLGMDGVTPRRMTELRVLHWTATLRRATDDAAAGTLDLGPLRAGVRDPRRFVAGVAATVHAAAHLAARLDFTGALVVRGYDDRGNSLFHNQPWTGEPSVGTWIESTTGMDVLPGPGHAHFAPGDLPAARAMERLAVALPLYLASRDEATGQPLWAPHGKRTARGATHWVVGRSVKLARETREAAAAWAAGEPTDRTVRVRHVVRGHFRTVGRDPRRVYVLPYWRGPAAGPGAPRTYDVR